MTVGKAVVWGGLAAGAVGLAELAGLDATGLFVDESNIGDLMANIDKYPPNIQDAINEHIKAKAFEGAIPFEINDTTTWYVDPDGEFPKLSKDFVADPANKTLVENYKDYFHTGNMIDADAEKTLLAHVEDLKNKGFNDETVKKFSEVAEGFVKDTNEVLPQSGLQRDILLGKAVPVATAGVSGAAIGGLSGNGKSEETTSPYAAHYGASPGHREPVGPHTTAYLQGQSGSPAQGGTAFQHAAAGPGSASHRDALKQRQQLAAHLHNEGLTT